MECAYFLWSLELVEANSVKPGFFTRDSVEEHLLSRHTAFCDIKKEIFLEGQSQNSNKDYKQ